MHVGLGLENQAELRSEGSGCARADIDPERSSGWFSSPSDRYTQTKNTLAYPGNRHHDVSVHPHEFMKFADQDADELALDDA